MSLIIFFISVIFLRILALTFRRFFISFAITEHLRHLPAGTLLIVAFICSSSCADDEVGLLSNISDCCSSAIAAELPWVGVHDWQEAAGTLLIVVLVCSSSCADDEVGLLSSISDCCSSSAIAAELPWLGSAWLRRSRRLSGSFWDCRHRGKHFSPELSNTEIGKFLGLNYDLIPMRRSFHETNLRISNRNL